MAKPLTASPFLILLVLFATSLTAVSGLGGKLGGRTKVKDVKANTEVQDLGRYSVQQFNTLDKWKENSSAYGRDLRFREVVEAETQVVAGIKYYLKIAAVTPAGVPKTFDAAVVVKAWVPSKELLDFNPSPSSK